MRQWQKSAIIMTFIAITFFWLGHVIRVINVGALASLIPNFRTILTVSLIAVVITFGWFIFKDDTRVVKTYRLLTIVAVFLAITTTGRIVIEMIRQPVIEPKQNIVTQPPTSKDLPDIYYIIVDGHGRSDILQEFFQHNNSAFIQSLEELGFYVAVNSTANYTNTYHSLASSLNYNYINYLETEDFDPRDIRPLQKLIKDNSVTQFLQERGYTFVVGSSGWTGTEEIAADITMAGTVRINEFETILLSTTVLDALTSYHFSYLNHHNRILYLLNHLDDVADDPRPTFTFAHVLSPHPPFVFNQDGSMPKHNYPVVFNEFLWTKLSDRSIADYVKGYRQQVNYIDKRLVEIATAIINRSTQPPIIIIQGDHGPAQYFDYQNINDTGLRERMSILNAYYAPAANQDFFSTITPVNTFRVIFNNYFNADLPLLSDRNYLTDFNGQSLNSFYDVTDIVASSILQPDNAN
ncbi:MAG: hypothetical protein ABIJ81_02555 [Patescibacteria group bacterium]